VKASLARECETISASGEMPMISRVGSRTALSFLVAGLIAATLSFCASDGGDLLNLDQTWTLQTVNDTTLPYTVPNAEHDIVVTAGVASLNSDNSYTTTLTGTTDGTAGTLGTDHGAWSVSSSTINFHSQSLHTDYVAALNGNTFRAAIPGALIGSSTAVFTMDFSDAK
jgi:hypothetical protein